MQDTQVRVKSNGDYWQAWWTDSAGRRRVKSLGPKSRVTRREAGRQCAALLADMARAPGLRDVGRSPTLGEWCDRYLGYRVGDLAASTMAIHRLTVKLLRGHFGEKRKLDRITRGQAADWRAALLRRMGEATVAKHCRVAKVILNTAARHDLVAMNPFDRLPSSGPTVEHEHCPLTDDMVSDVLEVAGEVAVWVAICWYAGLRKMEAYRLTWRDIDWAGNRLTVRPPGGKVTSKSRRREVRVECELMQILLNEFDRADRHAEYVVRARGKANTVTRHLQAAADRAGVPIKGLTLQALRRCRDTIWHNRYPAYVCAAWLGHSEQVAMKHYLTVPDELYEETSSEAGAVNDTHLLPKALAEIRRLKAELTTYQENGVHL